MTVFAANTDGPTRQFGLGGVANKITVRDLNFFYGEQQALFNVSMDLPANRISGIIGPSGCGKSTLLRVLNRMYDDYHDQRVAGVVTIDGEDILGSDVALGVLRRRVGMVFQTATVFPMSIFDNVAFGIKLERALSHQDLLARVEVALTRAALWNEVKDRLSEQGDSLSGGQQQRLCIARALAIQPEVLLLDEPTGALDPSSMHEVEDLLIDLKQSVTIVLVTHNMHQALRCADQVSLFYLGHLIESGSTEQIFKAPVDARTRNYVAGKFG